MSFLSPQTRTFLASAGGKSRLWQRLAISTNWPILVAIGVLSALGVISIWEDTLNDGTGNGMKQLIFLGVALGCMSLFQAVNYQKIGRYAWGFYFFSMALLLYTVAGAELSHGGQNRHPLPGVDYVKGAFCWIKLGPISLEPSELMKIAFILVLARYLRFRSSYRTVLGLLAPFAVAGVPMLIILKQPDLGVALIFIPPLFAMLYVAGARMRHLAAIVGLGIAVAPLLWFSGDPKAPVLKHLPQFVRGYQRDRVYSMFYSNSQQLRDVAYQQNQALAAMGSGGITGKGIGNLFMSKRVPERHNDMIFVVIGEQFGFVGSAVVLIAYVVLFAAGIEVASATRDPFGRLVAVGIISILASQTFLNLTVALKLMPVTGVTLPFISYGGSSLVASFMAAGLLLNIGQNRPIVMANNSFEFEEG
jgi:rod shape determining protein RodA